MSHFPKANQGFADGNPSARAGAGSSPGGRRLQPRSPVAPRPRPGARASRTRSPSSTARGRPQPGRPAARPARGQQARHLATVASTGGRGECLAGARVLPHVPLASLGSPSGARPVREVTGCPGGGHSPRLRFSREGRCWARLPGPDQRLQVAPARLRRKQPAHSIASSTRAASQAGAGGGKGEGRGGTGEKVREREGDPETSRPGHYVTSRWLGKGGAGAALVPPPGSGGGGASGRGRGRRESEWRSFGLRFRNLGSRSELPGLRRSGSGFVSGGQGT